MRANQENVKSRCPYEASTKRHSRIQIKSNPDIIECGNSTKLGLFRFLELCSLSPNKAGALYLVIGAMSELYLVCTYKLFLKHLQKMLT